MDKDIQEMFRKKNREMLIHNLELDIERNIAVLEESFTNIFNYQFDMGIKNIISMYINQDMDKEITTILLHLKNDLFSVVLEQVKSRSEKLLERVENLEFEEEKMKDYYDFVFSFSSSFEEILHSEQVQDFLEKAIFKLEEMSKQSFSQEESQIVNSRVYDYIHYRLFGKLEERILSEILIRDNNLANKGKESYEKFQELESKTSCSS